MSQYDKLDFLIVEAIKSGKNTFTFIYSHSVRDEADRLHKEAKRIEGFDAKPSFRFVDTRLQALRKRGLIEHRKGRGWIVKDLL